MDEYISYVHTIRTFCAKSITLQICGGLGRPIDIALFYQYDQQVPFSITYPGKNDDKEKMPDFFPMKKLKVEIIQHSWIPFFFFPAFAYN